MPKAVITGVSGQDGRLLARLLLDKGYSVVGISRNVTAAAALPAMPQDARMRLIEARLDSEDEIAALLGDHQPGEIYNLASQSSPELSWKRPLETGEATGMSAHRLFEAVHRHRLPCRIYQASSSEMFGDFTTAPQDENTPYRPVNLYAAAKVYAHHVAHIYRDALGLFVSCGILFNHESPLRGMGYLTQRIAYGVACASCGISESPLLNADGKPIVTGGKLLLGKLDAQRDWGSARDYVHAMWLMLQHPVADDFVIGTGLLRSVGDLCEIAYRTENLDWRDHVRTDPSRLRPADTGVRVADPRRARERLGWAPRNTIESTLAEMIAIHIAALRGSR